MFDEDGPWVRQVVASWKPIAANLAVDLLIFLTFWAVLYIVHKVSVIMPVGGTAGRALVFVHEVALVLNYVLLALLTIIDIVKFKMKGSGHAR